MLSFAVFLCAASNVSVCCVVWCWCVHSSGAWLLHRSQLLSVFLPPAYGLLCSQQSFIGFLLMVRAPSAPLGALFVLPLLLYGCPVHAVMGASPGPLPRHPSMLDWLLPACRPSPACFALPKAACFPWILPGWPLTSWILVYPHHQAGSQLILCSRTLWFVVTVHDRSVSRLGLALVPLGALVAGSVQSFWWEEGV